MSTSYKFAHLYGYEPVIVLGKTDDDTDRVEVVRLPKSEFHPEGDINYGDRAEVPTGTPPPPAPAGDRITALEEQIANLTEVLKGATKGAATKSESA